MKRCQVMFTFAAILCLPLVYSAPELKEPISDLDLCQINGEAERVCSACADLPYPLSLAGKECCSDLRAVEVCSACLADPVSCLAEVIDMTEDATDDLQINESPSEIPDSLLVDNEQQMDKRFGRIFLSRANRSPQLVKRYGSLFLWRQPYSATAYPRRWKRWGTLNLGSGWGLYPSRKRWGTWYLGRKMGRPTADKKWGTLHIGKRNDAFDKKWGTLHIGKRSNALDKKWGALYVGKRSDTFEQRDGHDKKWGTLNLGKKEGLNKKWGTLNLGKTRYDKKSRGEKNADGRTEASKDGSKDNISNPEKRYGRLFMSNLNGDKRFGSLLFGNSMVLKPSPFK